MSKEQYRVRNWSDYNKALVGRGSITLWFDEESIGQWHNQSSTGQVGRPRIYTDIAISCALMIKAVFHLPLRTTQGFIGSLIELLNLPINVPNYTTLSRRQASLEVELNKHVTQGPIDIVIDSTGLKVYGEGEWKVRQHGRSKRRTWRKLHLGINPETHRIEAATVTTNDYKDSEVIEDLLEAVDTDIGQVCADGAYDSENCYQAINERGGLATIPPRRDAKIKHRAHPDRIPHQRDENLRAIRKTSRKRWKETSGYHKRSLAETAMFRFKTIFGVKLDSRHFDNQATEAFIKCKAMNIMSSLGMPISVAA